MIPVKSARFALGILLELFAIARASLAAPLPDAFPQWKEIITDTSSNGADLIVIRLDDDIYRATSQLDSGLQVFQNDARVVPHLLRLATETQVRTQRQTWIPAKVALLPPQDKALEFLLTTDVRDRQIDGIQLQTSATNFYHLVTVSARNGNGDWQELVSQHPIYDLSQHYNFRHVDIPLATNQYDEFRVVIHDPIDEQRSSQSQFTETHTSAGIDTFAATHTVNRRPFQVERFVFWGEVAEKEHTEPVVQSYATSQFHAVPAQPGQPARFEFETHGQPLTEVTLLTDEVNFARPVTLEVESVTENGTQWQRVAQDQMQVISFRELNNSHLTLTFPENRATRWRLTVEDGENAPLKLTGVATRGTIHELVFLRKSNLPVRLYFGATRPAPAELDASTLEMILGQGYGGARLQLGPVQTNPTYHSSTDTSRPREFPHVVLWIVGFVLLLVTILGLASAATRIEKE